MPPPNPPKVDDCYEYWTEPPPEKSGRCLYWEEKFKRGWQPGRFIRRLGYDQAAHFYGVYIWEYNHIIFPLINGGN